MGNNKNIKNNMVKKNNKRGGKKKKSEIVFDESKRRDFLTGFRKRKQERRNRAKLEFEKKLKDEIKVAKEKAKQNRNPFGTEIRSASHLPAPEIEHLLDNTVSTNIHDLGSHTVSVTHLDLDKRRKKSDESENSDVSNEEEKPKIIKPSKPVDPKTLKKQLKNTNNKLQAFKKGKGGSKFNRKTTKSKRDKHYNPMRKVS